MPLVAALVKSTPFKMESCQVAQFLLFLQQWGPWLLIAYGGCMLFASTVLYDTQLRLLKKLIESSFITDRLNDPQTTIPHRLLMKWIFSWIDSPWLQPLSIAWAVFFILGGILWLVLR